MDKNELLDLVSKYDCEAFKNLTDQEWYALTNYKWDEDIIEGVLWRIAICEHSNDETIIYNQTLILKSIENAYKNIKDCHPIGEVPKMDGTELQLQILGGKFIPFPSALPTKKDGDLDYMELEHMVANYSMICSQMTTLTNDLHDRLRNSYDMLGLLNKREEENRQLKQHLEKHRDDHTNLTKVQAALKAQQLNFESILADKDKTIEELQTQCQQLSQQVTTPCLPSDNTNRADLSPFIVKMIKVAIEEPDRSRREIIYFFLKEVLEPYKDSMPKEILSALEKIRKGKPVNTEQLKLEIGKLSIGHVAGDLVMKKNVAHNVENVEPNAIGIQNN